MSIGKDRVGSVRNSMDRDAIDYARIGVMSGEGDQILRADHSYLEPLIEPLKSHLFEMLGLDAELEGSR